MSEVRIASCTIFVQIYIYVYIFMFLSLCCCILSDIGYVLTYFRFSQDPYKRKIWIYGIYNLSGIIGYATETYEGYLQKETALCIPLTANFTAPLPVYTL